MKYAFVTGAAGGLAGACVEEMMKRGGIGETSFDNIVPMALWKVIEANYSNGAYKTGYMNEALSELGATEYKIEVQPERINGIFVRIYHSVVTG